VAPSIELGGLPLRETDGELAKDPAVIRRVETASALWFTGGDQSRIMALLDPGSGPSCEQPDPLHRDPHPLYSAAWDVQANGGLIGGSSAGAAIMSHPMITGGRSEGALLNGCGKGGVSTAPGMGYFPFGIVDQHFLARGRMGRLLIATGSHGLRYGFGVEENSAMVVTLGDRPMIEVLGAAGLCILDLGEDPEFLVDTDGDGIPQSHDEFPYPWKFEVTLLGTGDRWDPLSGEAIPNRTRKPLALPAASPVPNPSTLGLWDSGAIATAIHRLSLNPNAPQILKSDNFQVQLSSGPGTRFLINSSYSNDIFAEKVQIHLTKSEARQ
ncbi:MAG: cyanophycinase, partial [Planctomycetota bacterium]|nr:cyanophycinase [Planctomycetota bacterium]